MRLLHTSDWHLGRRLHGADLTDAAEAWVDHVVEVVRSEAVDVLLVAGDVFDRAIPPVEALRTWERALQQVTAAGTQVVVSSGNHDSPARLGAHGALLARAGVHVRCDPARVAEPVVLHDEHGPVAFYPLPYLEPTTTAALLGRLSAHDVPVCDHVRRSQEGVVSRAAALAAADAAAAGRPRTVAMAHTWVAGLRPEDRSDSEREIGCCGPRAVGGDPVAQVGTLDRVATEAFAPFSYSALGHLHGPQVLDETLRYSGSPVAFSFSERHHRKGSWLVELDRDGGLHVDRVDAPVHRGLSQLTGTLEELLRDPAHTAAEADHVKVVLTDPARPADAMRRLQARFPHAVALEWTPVGRLTELPYAQRLAVAATDTDVALGFVAHVRGTAATAEEHAALDEAFRAVARAGDGEGAGADADDAGAAAPAGTDVVADAAERVLAELGATDGLDVEDDDLVDLAGLADPAVRARTSSRGAA